MTWSASGLRETTRGECHADQAAALEDLDATGRAVDPDAVAGRDPPRGLGRADHRGDPELARQHGRMRRRAARVGHEPGDLREQHDPRRVRHLADEDVALADLVELVDGLDDARDPLDDAGRPGDPGDDELVLGRFVRSNRSG